MGKIKTNKRLSAGRQASDPMGTKLALADEIESLKLAKTRTTDSASSNANKNSKRQADGEEFVSEKMTAKILMQARQQQSELQDEYGIGEVDQVNEQPGESQNKKTSLTLNEESSSIPNYRPFKKLQSSREKQQQIRKSDHDDSDSDSDTDEQLEDCENKRDFYSDEEIKINEEDQRAFDMFMSQTPSSRRTVADVIMEKLTEKKTELQTQMSDDSRTVAGGEFQLDDRVVRMYTQIKNVLQKYRSGKLPKAFKILPSLNNWEHILYITEPDMWSAAAVYQATRIFASNLNAKMAQRFII